MSNAITYSGIVNQQLAFAKAQWQLAGSVGGGFKSHSCKQAGLLQFCVGVNQYFHEINLLPDEDQSKSVVAGVTKLQLLGGGVSADFRFEQLRDLARDDSSWLATIAALEGSLMLPKPAETAVGENIIAVSLAPKLSGHWLNIELDELLALHQQCVALINAQREVSAEY